MFRRHDEPSSSRLQVLAVCLRSSLTAAFNRDAEFAHQEATNGEPGCSNCG